MKETCLSPYMHPHAALDSYRDALRSVHPHLYWPTLAAVTEPLAESTAVAGPLVATASTPAVAALPALEHSLWTLLRRDAARYDALGGWHSELGFWVGATYRYGAWASRLPALLRIPLMLPYRIINRVWRLFLQVNIACQAQIGPGLCLIHPASIWIPPTRIGENVLIFHEVTLGSNLGMDGFPVIGDNVDIYCGARVLGGISVGSGSKIGANCVVTSSLKPRSLVALPPMRVLSPPGS